MQLSSLVGHTVEVFAKFRERPQIPADSVLRKFFHDRRYLGGRDRRFIADLYFNTVKHWRRLEALVTDAFEDKESTASRLVAAALIVLESKSASEVATLFAEGKSGEKLSMAALEIIADREHEVSRLTSLSDDERLAITHSYPTWFVTLLRNEYPDSVEAILAALNQNSPLWVRANTLVSDREALRAELEKEGIATEPSEKADNALRLEKRVNTFGLKSFTRGAFEVQDEASQLVAPFAEIRKTAIKALDACAGAGGKTLHLAALMKNHGEIFATDVEAYKLEELRRRSRRAGAQNIRIVTPEEREKRLGEDKLGWFDLVLLDAPCTGSGTLRRNPGIKWLLTEQMLEELVQKQRDILQQHAGFVKPGGKLLYATCSVLKEEGEKQVEWFVSQHPEFTLEATLRTEPDSPEMDCFFVARLRKESKAIGVPRS
jgi:16S rRNA (cytosine967-C5)-methyltransferase